MQTVRDRNLGAGAGWSMLPKPNRQLTALAHDVVRLAQPLLPAGRDLFLSIETDAEAELTLTWWRAGDFAKIAKIAATPEGFCMSDTAEGALQEASVDLLGYLAGRWPSPPAIFGIVCDGSGIAFAPADPAPSAPGWMLRYAHGDASLLAILPLNPAGPCGLLGGDLNPAAIH